MQKRFLKHVELLSQSGYERLVRVKKSNDKRVDILAKQKGKYVKEFLILCSSDNKEVLVLLEGKFFREDFEKLVDMGSNKQHGRSLF